MIQIFNEEYNTIVPQPKINAVTVMNLEDAKKAFMHLPIDFAIIINEKTGKFARCFNMAKAEEFYSEDSVTPRKIIIDKINKIKAEEKMLYCEWWKDIYFSADNKTMHISKVNSEKLEDKDLVRFFEYILLMRTDISTNRVNKQYFL